MLVTQLYYRNTTVITSEMLEEIKEQLIKRREVYNTNNHASHNVYKLLHPLYAEIKNRCAEYLHFNTGFSPNQLFLESIQYPYNEEDMVGDEIIEDDDQVAEFRCELVNILDNHPLFYTVDKDYKIPLRKAWRKEDKEWLDVLHGFYKNEHNKVQYVADELGYEKRFDENDFTVRWCVEDGECVIISDLQLNHRAFEKKLEKIIKDFDPTKHIY